MDDLPGVDQSSHDLAADTESEVTLHARAHNASELAARSVHLSGGGDPNQWRLRPRVGGGLPAAGKHCGNGKGCGQASGQRDRHARPHAASAGTRGLEAFHSWRLMKLGARRRMRASRLDCPGRISCLPARNAAMACFTSSSVVIVLIPASSNSLVMFVWTAGGISSMTSTPLSSSWKRRDWV